MSLATTWTSTITSRLGQTRRLLKKEASLPGNSCCQPIYHKICVAISAQWNEQSWRLPDLGAAFDEVGPVIYMMPSRCNPWPRCLALSTQGKGLPQAAAGLVRSIIQNASNNILTYSSMCHRPQSFQETQASLVTQEAPLTEQG